MFEEHIKRDGSILYTEGLEEFGHLNFLLEAEDEDFISEGERLLKQLVEMVSEGIKRFSADDKLSLQGLFTKLVEEQNTLVLYEPVPDQNRKKIGDFAPIQSQTTPTKKDVESGVIWKRGIGNGLACLQDVGFILEVYDLDPDFGDGMDLSQIYTSSANVIKSEQIVLQRKAPMANHSGWEIVAREDQGNPACFSHPMQSNLWADKSALVQFLCLPVGSKVLWKKDSDPVIEVPQSDKDSTTPAWDEPDEIWTHHHPTEGNKADKIVCAQLQPKNLQAPEWEWLAAKEISNDIVELCSIPFLVHGLALGDQVKINQHGVVEKRIKRSGNIAIRVQIIEKEEGTKYPLLDYVKENSIAVEWMNDRVFAVSFSNRKFASEFLSILENTDNMMLVSHSMPISHNPISKQFLQLSLPNAFHAGAFVALLEGLFLQAEQTDKLFLVFGLFVVNSVLLWLITLSRLWRPSWEMFNFGQHQARVAASVLVFSSLFWMLVMTTVLGSQFWLSNALSALVMASVSAWVWKASPSNPDLPRKPEPGAVPVSPYRYARAELAPPSTTALSLSSNVSEKMAYAGSKAGRLAIADDFCPEKNLVHFVEIFCAEKSDEAVQAVFYDNADMKSVSFESFYQAVSTISKQRGLRASDWWMET